MKFTRMPIEMESPEQMGYSNLKFNLTESSVRDLKLGDLKLHLQDLKLEYGHHAGLHGLREAIASEHAGLNSNQVLITSGAAAALFIVNTSLLEPGDEILVMRPNYGTTIETPKALGAKVNYIELDFDHGFKPDLSSLEQQLSNKTKLISITNPNNPTGVCLSQDELNQLISLAEKFNCYLLVDETYRDLWDSKYPLAACASDKVISVSSLSKAYGLPGIRMGWIITKNPVLLELFLAAKEQIFICNSILDETIAQQFFAQKEKIQARINEHLQVNRSILFDFLNANSFLECVKPQGGVVCFPRIKLGQEVNMKKFYSTLSNEFGTFVGPGYWFDMPHHYMRIGYGWPTAQELRQGLEHINECLSRFQPH